jgi:hypothetical protein
MILHMGTSRLLIACVTVSKRNIRLGDLLLQLVDALSYEQIIKIIIVLYLLCYSVAHSVNKFSLLITIISALYCTCSLLCESCGH